MQKVAVPRLEVHDCASRGAPRAPAAGAGEARIRACDSVAEMSARTDARMSSVTRFVARLPKKLKTQRPLKNELNELLRLLHLGL